jgi:hypothetical protein
MFDLHKCIDFSIKFHDQLKLVCESLNETVSGTDMMKFPSGRGMNTNAALRGSWQDDRLCLLIRYKIWDLKKISFEI